MEALLKIDPSLEKVVTADGPVINVKSGFPTTCHMEKPDSCLWNEEFTGLQVTM